MTEIILILLCSALLIGMPLLVKKMKPKNIILLKIIGIIILLSLLLFTEPRQRWWTYIIFALVICKAIYDVYKIILLERKNPK
jgi:Na+/melibiose symporter-like transporter